MRIEAIDLIHISIPLVSPFRISRGVISDRHMLLVRLHSEGAFGWAEAGADLLPLYTYETVGTVRHVIADLFAEEILARDWPEEGGAHAVAEHHGKWPWHPMAKAAIEEPVVGQALEFTFRESHGVNEGEGTHLENVCGIWPGTDLKDEVIILSAHYDHVGVTGGEIFNGADDNGSGTCGLLAVAEALTHYGPMRRTIMLMWVSAEEKGLLGSAAWTKNPWLPEGMKAIANVNIDMIGRNAPAQLHITPTSEHDAYNGLTKVAERNAPLEGFPVLGSADAYWNRSDHANFSRNMGLPVAFLFSDVHEDYHKSTDTPDKIDYDKIRRVSRLVVRMLHDLQADQLDL